MFLSADQNIHKLTCHNTGDLGHEAFDSSDGDTFSLMLDACDNVFNLQRKDSGEVRKGAKQNKTKKNRDQQKRGDRYLSFNDHNRERFDIVEMSTTAPSSYAAALKLASGSGRE